MIIRTVETGMYQSNCYIIGSEPGQEGIIIDPGDEAEHILKEVKALNLTIKLIIATHGHLDHIAALPRVKKATGAPLGINPKDAAPPEGNEDFVWSGVKSASFKADRGLEDGDEIRVGELRFRVLATPGHTPGGICLYGHEVVFTGDTLFYGSVGRSDFAGGSHNQLIQSIKTKLLVLPDNTTVYPGHGPATSIGQEKRINPFL